MTKDTFSLGAGLDVNGFFNLTAGTFVQRAYLMNVAGNFTIANGATFIKASGGQALTFDGNLTFTDNNPTKQNLGNLVIGTSPAIIDLASDLSADSLTINPNDILYTNGYDLDIGIGGITINSNGTLDATDDGERDLTTINLEGNFSNSGTFTHGNSTLILDGSNQTISGSTTFYNLTKTVTLAYTLTFDNTATQTIIGTMTLKGSAGQLLSLGSDVIDQQWEINPQGTRDILYLDVKDSHNINPTPIVTAGLNIIDSGNNTGWNFNTSPFGPTALGPSFLVDGSWTNTTTPTFQFNLSNPDPSDTVKYRIQLSTTSTFSVFIVDYISAFGPQDSFTFRVGQAAGGGSYIVGSEGQTLGEADYYWRVQNIGNNNATSFFTLANSGNIAFRVDTSHIQLAQYLLGQLLSQVLLLRFQEHQILYLVYQLPLITFKKHQPVRVLWLPVQQLG